MPLELIPGPSETEDEYRTRCQQLKRSDSPLFSPLAKHLFEVEAPWVSLHYKNKGLHFWEGGCTWIEGESVTLQLKKVFETKSRYLLLYSKEELIAHEVVHAARSAFEEPLFEEVLAYQTASSSFRKYMGPLFRSSKEVLGLWLTLATLFITPWIGTAVSFFFVFRLIRTQRLFASAKRKALTLVPPEKVLPLLVRLSDQEILTLARSASTRNLKVWIEEQTSFRWRLIKDEYF